MAQKTIKLVANNKKARHDYFIDETYQAGISLTGTEIKLELAYFQSVKLSHYLGILYFIALGAHAHQHIDQTCDYAYGNHKIDQKRFSSVFQFITTFCSKFVLLSALSDNYRPFL